MNIQDYAQSKQHNISTVKAACKYLFERIPEDLDSHQLQQLDSHLNGDEPVLPAAIPVQSEVDLTGSLSLEFLAFCAQLKEQVSISQSKIDQGIFVAEQKAYAHLAQYQKTKFEEAKDRVNKAIEAANLISDSSKESGEVIAERIQKASFALDSQVYENVLAFLEF